MSEEVKKTHYTKSILIKERGWTEKAIKLFLGDHDKEKPNPYYSSASPMKLYLIERVKKKEQSKEFKDFKNNSKKNGSKKAIATKKKQITELITGLNIKIQKEKFSVIRKKAIQSYNQFKEDISFKGRNPSFEFQKADLKSNKEFLNRIIVNYIRHKSTKYDYKLQKIFGKVGKQEAYKLLNKKIYDKISEVYPQLKEECNNQIHKKK